MRKNKLSQAQQKRQGWQPEQSWGSTPRVRLGGKTGVDVAIRVACVRGRLTGYRVKCQVSDRGVLLNPRHQVRPESQAVLGAAHALRLVFGMPGSDSKQCAPRRGCIQRVPSS